jgi:hypothetical protein
MIQQHSCTLCWFTCNLISIPKLSRVAARGFINHSDKALGHTHASSSQSTNYWTMTLFHTTTRISCVLNSKYNLVHSLVTIINFCETPPLVTWRFRSYDTTSPGMWSPVIFFRTIAWLCGGHKQKLEAFPPCYFLLPFNCRNLAV